MTKFQIIKRKKNCVDQKLSFVSLFAGQNGENVPLEVTIHK